MRQYLVLLSAALLSGCSLVERFLPEPNGPVSAPIASPRAQLHPVPARPVFVPMIPDAELAPNRDAGGTLIEAPSPVPFELYPLHVAPPKVSVPATAERTVEKAYETPFVLEPAQASEAWSHDPVASAILKPSKTAKFAR